MKKDIFNALGMNYEIGESKELNKMGIRGFKGSPKSTKHQVNCFNPAPDVYKVEHPFYRNTCTRKRSIGVDPFKNMQRFDEDPCFKPYSSPNKNKSNIKERMSPNKSVGKRKHSNSLSKKKSSHRSVSKNNDMNTIIQPYKNIKHLFDFCDPETQDKRNKSKEKCCIDAKVNEWISNRKRKLQQRRSEQKNNIMKECTFHPKINKQPILSPSPKYKYHDLQKNLEKTYFQQLMEKREVKHKDEYELYGKYLE